MHAVAQLVEALRYNSEGCGFVSRWCHWIFSLILSVGTVRSRTKATEFSLLSFRSHYGPGVDSASNRNEYQECFLGVKAAGA